MPLTPEQTAFDAAVKARADFLYRGLANLEQLRTDDPSLAPVIDQMVLMRDALNRALAIEGQHIVGDAPHAPLYFDYLDSEQSNCKAFADPHHSFIGMTVRRFRDVLTMAQQLAADGEVLSSIGLLPAATNRAHLEGLLLWILVVFAVSHEYAHHTHGHLANAKGEVGRLRQQACEADADGWAAYLMLNNYILEGGREALVSLLGLEHSPAACQDAVACGCVVAAYAAFIFRTELKPIDPAKARWDTHPPPAVRLTLMSKRLLVFASGHRPQLSATLTEAWWGSLIRAVSALMWRGRANAELWHAHAIFLRTDDGVAYVDALTAELDAFRALLRQWEADERAKGELNG